MKITLLLSILLLGLVLLLSPNRKSMRHINQLMNDNIEFFQERTNQELKKINRIGQAYPQYLPAEQAAKKVDSLSGDALKNDWSLYQLDTMLLSDVPKYNLMAIAESLNLKSDSLYSKDNLNASFYPTYRQLSIQQKRSIQLYHIRINAEGDAYFEDKTLYLSIDNTPIRCGQPTEIKFYLINNAYHWTPSTFTKAIWINGKKQRLEKDKATYTVTPTRTGWQYFTIQTKNKLKHQKPQFSEKRCYYYVSK